MSKPTQHDANYGRPISVYPAGTKEYRDNYEKIFGKKEKPKAKDKAKEKTT